jgi:predicted DNA-binding protein
MSSVVIDLPNEVSEQLDQLAQEHGQSKSDYLLEVIAEHLGDLEDLRIAERRYREHLASGSKGIPLKEVMRELGLDD